VAGRIRSIEKSNDLIGIRTRDLPACSIVPQPVTLPRALNNINLILLKGIQRFLMVLFTIIPPNFVRLLFLPASIRLMWLTWISVIIQDYFAIV
jgi:hypothetical protein